MKIQSTDDGQETIRVEVLLTGGFQVIVSLPGDSDLLVRLLSVFSASAAERTATIFNIHTNDGTASTVFSGAHIVAIRTMPPVVLETQPKAPPCARRESTPVVAGAAIWERFENFIGENSVDLLEVLKRNARMFSHFEGRRDDCFLHVATRDSPFNGLQLELRKSVERVARSVLDAFGYDLFAYDLVFEVCAYGDGSYFGPKNVDRPSANGKRTIEFIYFVLEDDRRFEGALVRLFNVSAHNGEPETLAVEFRPAHDVAIFFPSHSGLAVTPVRYVMTSPEHAFYVIRGCLAVPA